MTDSPHGSSTDALASAQAAVAQVVAGIGAAQWNARTPCTEWTVRELLSHLVGGDARAAVRLAEPPPGQDAPGEHGQGEHAPGTTRVEQQPDDVLGDDPVGAYRRNAEALRAALAASGAPGRLVQMPIGTVPVPVAAQLRLVEALVHGWDLAAATGQRLTVPDELAEQALTFTRASLGNVPAGRRPFADPQPVADDAAPLDRLVALLGRDVQAAG